MVVPQKLEAGDVVQFITVDRYQQHNVRRCKILSIEEPDRNHKRYSEVYYLDTEEVGTRYWKAIRGVSRPEEVYAGPKLDAARAGKARIQYKPMNGGWIWFDYLEETAETQ